jgi:DNA-binding NarL/FixJ family response regulator
MYDLPYPLSAGERVVQPCPLTYREVDVLRRLSRGEVYKQIAKELDLAPSTVRSHLHRVYKKLGVVDRAQAVLLATERGWI